jgi:hypothetical protein
VRRNDRVVRGFHENDGGDILRQPIAHRHDVQGVFCRAAFLPIPIPILETLSGAINGAVMPKGRPPQYAKPKMPKRDERAS